MSESNYMLDNDWINERERFDAIERNLDPGTIHALTEIGVSSGWNCLEVGAGGGSITEWLCKRVGPEGTVTALDLNTRFVATLDYANLEARVQNVVTEDVPKEEYQLVHSRFTLAHIPERDSVLVKMVQAVRPGGWILIEEPDFSTEGVVPESEGSKRQLFESGIASIKEFQRQRGMDIYYGHALFGKLNSLGVTNVRSVGRSLTVQGGTPESREVALTMEQLQAPAIATNVISEPDYLEFRSLFDDEDFYFRMYMMVSTWGQKAS